MNDNKQAIYSPEFIPYYPEEAEKHGLSMVETILYGFIRFYTKRGAKFYFSNEDLSRIIHTSRATITRILTRMEKIGLFETEYQPKANGGTIRFINPTTQNEQSERPLLKMSSLTTQNEQSAYPEEVQGEKNDISVQANNKIKKNKIGEPNQTISTPASELEPMLGTHPDLLAYKERKAVRAAKKAMGLKYGGSVPAYAKANFERELAKQRVMIAHEETHAAVVGFPTIESITPEVIAAIAREKRIHIEDCEEVFETMKTRVRGQGSGKWRDMAEMLRSYVDNAIRFGHIDKILTFREQTLRDYGIDIGEDDQEPDQLTTYENKEQQV